jgi:ferric-dicitrate binding protein FerR (iron transport regulator)
MMSERRHLALAFLLSAALLPANGFAAAKPKVGIAASVENRVEGVLGSAVETLSAGSEVFDSQLVRTGEASKAGLRFLDDTTLSLSAQSEVKLDKFVYQGGKTGAMVVQVPRGLMRFVTGTLDHKSYAIRTPIAGIGVRGTEFEVLVRGDRITALLTSGAIVIRTQLGRTYLLRTPNSAITIHRDGRVLGPRAWNGTTMEFANLALPAPPAQPPASQGTRKASTPTDPARPSGGASTGGGSRVLGPGLLEGDGGFGGQGPASAGSPVRTPTAPPRGGGGAAGGGLR